MEQNKKRNIKLELDQDQDQDIIKISPFLYGIFFEDINFGGDGGMYAELISNRSFENFDYQENKDLRLMAWEKVQSDDSRVELTVKSSGGINTINPNYLNITMIESGKTAGVKNLGYHNEGFYIKSKETYRFSAYLRAEDLKGELTVCLQSGSNQKVAASETIHITEPSWKKYEIIMQAEETLHDAQLVLLVKQTKSMDLDVVSLFPTKTYKNRVNGLRADMVETLKALEPKFLRFPGGCIVEGRSFQNMYRWKETIGPIEERKTNWNRWQLDEYQIDGRNSSDYFQTYGLGYYEYFLLSEDLGATPMPIMNIGMTCQWHESLLVPMDRLDPFIQDILDLIEFANGDATTTWGRKRIEFGHPGPFNLEYIGVGNEQWGQDYFDRYEKCHRIVKEKYPNIQLITSAGWTAQGKDFDFAQNWMKQASIKADLIDEHYYAKPQWFVNNVHRYDDYDRQLSKVFAGEYACHLSNRKNAWEAALVEAAVMTGFEKNSDHVWMTCYAPLFGKLDHFQWYPNLIWFNNESVVETPSYYVQQLFSQDLGDRLIKSEVENCDYHLLDLEAEWKMPEQFHLVSSYRESDQTIIIKAVNTSLASCEGHIQIVTDRTIDSVMTEIVLKNKDLSSENSLEFGKTVYPVTQNVPCDGKNMTYVFDGYSVTVLKIKVKNK